MKRHMTACRYAGQLLTPETVNLKDCCCYPADDPTERCGRVTGHTKQPMDWKARRGAQRDDGRYLVLCGYPAKYMVHGSDAFGPKLAPTCSRDLESVVEDFDGAVTVVKL